MSEELLSKREIYNTLKRLVAYYDGRARVANKLMHESTDAQSAFEKATAATRWEAKRDAVFKVAENLEIALEDEGEL